MKYLIFLHAYRSLLVEQASCNQVSPAVIKCYRQEPYAHTSHIPCKYFLLDKLSATLFILELQSKHLIITFKLFPMILSGLSFSGDFKCNNV
jgi:hypothetical protein